MPISPTTRRAVHKYDGLISSVIQMADEALHSSLLIEVVNKEKGRGGIIMYRLLFFWGIIITDHKWK